MEYVLIVGLVFLALSSLNKKSEDKKTSLEEDLKNFNLDNLGKFTTDTFGVNDKMKGFTVPKNLKVDDYGNLYYDEDLERYVDPK